MPNAALCPICGQHNECQALEQSTGKACWCVDHYFSPELLRQVPPELVNKACICPRCAQAYEKQSKQAEHNKDK